MHFKDTEFLESISQNVETILSLQSQMSEISSCIELITKTLKRKNKVFICGNGGSAAQAEHFSTEFLVRLNPKVNRKPYPIVPLSFNNSHLTAYANDFHFEDIFVKTLQALATKNDCLIVLSTSGKSKNILKVLKFSKKLKIKSIGFLGFKSDKYKLADVNLFVNSSDTARIQEAHLFLGHFILNEVEKKLKK